MHQTRYEGYIVLAQLKRLCEGLDSDLGDVDVVIETGFDPQRLCYIKGQANVEVSMTCQRCNETMSIELSAEFAYTPVASDFEEDEERPLPERYEPVFINEVGEVSVHDMVEDELILDIPLIAKHDEQDCSASGSNMTWGKIEEVVEKKPNPFAVLKQLKRN